MRTTSIQMSSPIQMRSETFLVKTKMIGCLPWIGFDYPSQPRNRTATTTSDAMMPTNCHAGFDAFMIAPTA